MKHVALDFNFIYNQVQTRALRVAYVSSTNQLADALTNHYHTQDFSLVGQDWTLLVELYLEKHSQRKDFTGLYGPPENPKQNKLFENALAIFDQDSPDRWHNLARAVGGKTVEEVKMHYQLLVDDVQQIEAGGIPLPNYRRAGASNKSCNCIDEEQRMKSLSLH
ncbi:unnamed protein product [Dovyalis caffra]|uniref:RADIALIS n=1 Tax=Dovyalis caffra TaxID=77055 RepID=A0AAV1SFU7_9ROSI|nr:unnamed protein product [Dovyalis caffra]